MLEVEKILKLFLRFGTCSYRFWLSLGPSLNDSTGAGPVPWALPWGLKVKPNGAGL